MKCVVGRMGQVFTNRKQPEGRLKRENTHGMFYTV